MNSSAAANSNAWSFVKVTLVLVLLVLEYSTAAPVSLELADVNESFETKRTATTEAAASVLEKSLSDHHQESESDLFLSHTQSPHIEYGQVLYDDVTDLSRSSRRKSYRNKYLTDPNSPLQRKSAKKRFKADRNLQRVEKKSWNLPTQTLGHYLDIKDQAKQAARKAHELRKLLNSMNDI